MTARSPAVSTVEMSRFLVLARVLNFTRAAAEMHITQQLLSAQIKHLEREIGTPLFTRSTHRVELTAAGHEFRSAVDTALESFDRGVQRARRAGSPSDRVLTIGFLAHSIDLQVEAIEVMQDRHAELTLAFRSHVFDDPFNGLLAGTTDVALLSHHAGHPDIETMTVMEEGRVCLVPNGHVLAQRRVLTPADFLDLPAIVIDGVDTTNAVKAWSDALALTEEIGTRPVGASVGTAQEWLLAAAGGKGFSTAPMSVTRYTAHPGVSAVPVINVKPLLVSVGWIRGRKSSLVQEFVDVVDRLARDSRGGTTL